MIHPKFWLSFYHSRAISRSFCLKKRFFYFLGNNKNLVKLELKPANAESSNTPIDYFALFLYSRCWSRCQIVCSKSLLGICWSFQRSSWPIIEFARWCTSKVSLLIQNLLSAVWLQSNVNKNLQILNCLKLKVIHKQYSSTLFLNLQQSTYNIYIYQAPNIFFSEIFLSVMFFLSKYNSKLCQIIYLPKINYFI